jgi:hypothetical protein
MDVLKSKEVKYLSRFDYQLETTTTIYNNHYIYYEV